jgi:hypothetical protein
MDTTSSYTKVKNLYQEIRSMQLKKQTIIHLISQSNVSIKIQK